MLTRIILLASAFLSGVAVPFVAMAEDEQPKAEAAIEVAKEAIKEEAPAAAEAPKVEPAAVSKTDAPELPKPPPPAPIAAPTPMKMEMPKPPEAPKMEPPKIDKELQAATDRWVALSDAQRLEILEDWKKLPEENRVPFMIYRDDATKKVKPEAAAAPAAEAEADDAPAQGGVVIQQEEKKEEGLLDKIF